jgi:hypothetical protein
MLSRENKRGRPHTKDTQSQQNSSKAAAQSTADPFTQGAQLSAICSDNKLPRATEESPETLVPTFGEVDEVFRARTTTTGKFTPEAKCDLLDRVIKVDPHRGVVQGFLLLEVADDPALARQVLAVIRKTLPSLDSKHDLSPFLMEVVATFSNDSARAVAIGRLRDLGHVQVLIAPLIDRLDLHYGERGMIAKIKALVRPKHVGVRQIAAKALSRIGFGSASIEAALPTLREVALDRANTTALRCAAIQALGMCRGEAGYTALLQVQDNVRSSTLREAVRSAILMWEGIDHIIKQNPSAYAARYWGDDNRY